ncbi:MAG: hypothetical protein QOG53_3147 [Frankiales bacterium]|jgi:hypothetical protein|nr:hypothetical protein [Frankiales bacterium]
MNQRLAVVTASMAILTSAAAGIPLALSLASQGPSTDEAALYCIEKITVSFRDHPIATTPVICVPGP